MICCCHLKRAGQGRCRDQLQPRFKISLGPRRPILLVHWALADCTQ